MTRADWARPKIGLIVGSRLCARILLDRVVEISLLCESAPMRKSEAGVSPPQSRFLLFIGSTLASLSQSGRLTASAVKCCPIPRFALTRTVSVLSKHSSLKKKDAHPASNLPGRLLHHYTFNLSISQLRHHQHSTNFDSASLIRYHLLAVSVSTSDFPAGFSPPSMANKHTSNIYNSAQTHTHTRPIYET